MSSSDVLELPPVDGSQPLFPDALDFHARHNPSRPIYVFPFPDLDSDKLNSVSYLEFAHATHRIAHILRPERTGPEKAVVAILVNCDTLLYHALFLGIIRAGLVPFPMSPRNPAIAVASMMERVGCHRIVSQPGFSSLTDGVRETLPSSWPVQVDDLPDLTDVFPSLVSAEPSSISVLYPPSSNHWSLTDIVFYLHSSGSTGLPKPIPNTHQTIWHWCNLPLHAESRKHGIRWGSMSLPPFHVMAVSSHLFAPLLSGHPTSLYPPMGVLSAQPVVPTPQNTIETARKTRCTIIEVVPSFVEAWAQSEDDIKFLASINAVVFGGGPLSYTNGQKLVSNGVRLFSLYGTTEIGPLTGIFNDDVDEPSPVGKTREDWEWIQFPKECALRWIAQDDGTFELQVLDCPTHKVCVENLPNGEHGYATSDLLERHPTKPGLYRIVGRLDDVIVLGSGEKTVPIPQENHIGAHPWVAGAVMFGRGHQQVGVLVEPQPGHEVAPGDEKALINFRDAIWPYVEEANHLAPAFSRIFKEMILASDPARPFVRAAKGTIQRKKILELYEDDIRQLYATVEESKDSHGIVPPPSWSVPDIEAWLLEHATAINEEKQPDPKKDLFEQGFDSLSATYLRNRIIGALREASDPTVNSAAQQVTPNIIFQHHTLVSLARAVGNLVHPETISDGQSPSAQIDEMIAKYTANLPSLPVTNKATKNQDGAVVLLTGSTGSLGAHILSLLLADSRVKRVYALNRGHNLLDRQRAAFKSAELPSEFLDISKLVFLSADFARDDLGLDAHVLDELSGTLTHIIHNAWRVDFNLALPSFETQIATSIRLLALAPRAHYLFTSSISVAAGWHTVKGGGRVPESPLHDSAVPALTWGYGMSKYVVEEVLSKARDAGMHTTSLRIGQISGSQKSGAWNSSDWVPSIIKTSLSLGALPDLQGFVSWVPMNAVAGTVLDIMFATDTPALINVVHPRPVVWRTIASAVNTELQANLPYVSFEEWVNKIGHLADSSPSAEIIEQTPGIKLLEFFRNASVHDSAAKKAGNTDIDVAGLPLFETEVSESVSPTLADLHPLNEDDVKTWIRFWRSQHFLA